MARSHWQWAVVLLTVLIVGFLTLQTKEDADDIHALLKNCSVAGQRKERSFCYRQTAKSLLTIHELGKIMASVQGLVSDPAFSADCHEFLHYLGREAFYKTRSVAEPFKQATSICDSGIYHGIMEGYMTGKEDILSSEVRLSSAVLHACDELTGSGAPLGLYWICYHGLGHGLMFLTNNELPASLRYCDAAPAGAVKACYTGVFMENAVSSTLDERRTHPSKYVDPDDPTYPCQILGASYQENCYFSQASFFLKQKKFNYRETFPMCSRIPSEFQKTCFIALGANVPDPPFTDTKGMAEKCLLAVAFGKAAYEGCILGAVQFLTQARTGDATALAEFCSSVQEAQKSLCIRESGNALTAWVSSQDNLKEKCAAFGGEKEVRLCLGLK